MAGGVVNFLLQRGGYLKSHQFSPSAMVRLFQQEEEVMRISRDFHSQKTRDITYGDECASESKGYASIEMCASTELILRS